MRTWWILDLSIYHYHLCSAKIYKEKLSSLRSWCFYVWRETESIWSSLLTIAVNVIENQFTKLSIILLYQKQNLQKEKINAWNSDLWYKTYQKEPFPWFGLAIIISDSFICFAEIKTKALYSSWIISINRVYFVAFDEIAPIFIQAQNHPILSKVKWYTSDSSTLNNKLI